MVLFLAFLVLPVFLKAAVLWMRRSLTVTLSTAFTDERTKREVRYQISARNRSFLPITACQVTLLCKNRMVGGHESQTVRFSVPAVAAGWCREPSPLRIMEAFSCPPPA